MLSIKTVKRIGEKMTGDIKDRDKAMPKGNIDKGGDKKRRR